MSENMMKPLISASKCGEHLASSKNTLVPDHLLLNISRPLRDILRR